MAISARKCGRRGTPPIDVAPKRELYIHHTVTSNRRRTREDERRHMRELEQFHIARGFLTIGYSPDTAREAVSMTSRPLPCACGTGLNFEPLDFKLTYTRV